jgi:hypothetical protein
LSGKIKCGSCGSSFISRTKKNKQGNRYRVWRCGKTTTEGTFRADSCGHSVGCSVGHQIREDVAMGLLKQAVQLVPINSERISYNLTRIVQSVLKESSLNVQIEKRRIEREMEIEQQKKQSALEGFLEQTIRQPDYQFMKERYDIRIAQLKEQMISIEKRWKSNTWPADIKDNIFEVIRSIVGGEGMDEIFYGQLLHHMTVFSNGKVEVFLNALPFGQLFIPDEPT